MILEVVELRFKDDRSVNFEEALSVRIRLFDPPKVHWGNPLLRLEKCGGKLMVDLELLPGSEFLSHAGSLMPS